MVQKNYRETKAKGTEKKKFRNWVFRGVTKRARRHIIFVLEKKAKILEKKGKTKEAEEIRERIKQMKGK